MLSHSLSKNILFKGVKTPITTSRLLSSTNYRDQQLDSKRSEPFYSIKTQVDEYVYYKTLGKKWRPLVYREKNSIKLPGMNAIDFNGKPMIPRKYPGVPSKHKFVKFIEKLLVIEEFEALTVTFRELDSHLPDFLEPTMINAYLFKSLEFGKFPEALTFVQNLKSYKTLGKYDVRNCEYILNLRAFETRQKGFYTVDYVQKKIDIVLRPATLAGKTIATPLSNYARLNCWLNLQLNQLSKDSVTSEKLTKAVAQVLNEDLGNGVEFDAEKDLENPVKAAGVAQHAFTILKTFVNVVSELPTGEQEKFKALVDQQIPFLNHVELLMQKAEITDTVFDKLCALPKISGEEDAESVAAKEN